MLRRDKLETEVIGYQKRRDVSQLQVQSKETRQRYDKLNYEVHKREKTIQDLVARACEGPANCRNMKCVQNNRKGNLLQVLNLETSKGVITRKNESLET